MEAVAIAAKEAPESYRRDLVSAERRDDGDGAQSLRLAAAARFRELGFPTTRQEEWRHTNVAPIVRTPFSVVVERSQLTSADVESLFYEGCRNVVFVDGVLAPELSQLEGAALEVGSLGDRLRGSQAGDAMAHLGRYASYERHPFVALNTALFRDGAWVRVAEGVVLEEPLHLLFVATATGDAARASYPRNLILAGEHSQATVLETYATVGDGDTLVCPVTEVIADPSAVLRHFKIQKESGSASHVSTLQVQLARNVSFTSLSLSYGGALVRNDINAVLDGEGIHCALDGLYVVAGKQFIDHHMRVEHKQPHCTSHQLYKGILDGRSRGVFNGRIYVHDGAQKTDAVQTNRNLLLSREALVNSNPQLEIFADDVKCTHGSTIGQLDADAVFYLRSRGISEVAARSLLTYAFASELVERIEVEALRQDIEEMLFERLPGGEQVREAR